MLISKTSDDSKFVFLSYMHDYVCFIAPIDYRIELSLVDEIFCENCSHFVLI